MTTTFYYAGHTYVIETVGRNLTSAISNATAIGAHLAKIESAVENSAVYNAIVAKVSIAAMPTASDGGGAKYVRIGASDTAQEGQWVWHDGTTVGYNNWGSGPFGTEPDDYQGQDSAGIGFNAWPQPSGGIGVAGEWNDIDVTNLLWSLYEYDYLRGTAGADTLTGTAGVDTIIGSAGNDRLKGLSGNDFIDGGDNADSLWGGTGGDMLTGGLGKDLFVYQFKADSGLALATRDTITDLRRLEGDRIDLRQFDPVPTGGADSKFVIDSGGAFVQGEIRLVVSGANTIVSINLDADVAAEMTIIVQGRTDLVATDFLL